MKRDRLQSLYDEAARLAGEIANAQTEIARRTHLWRSEGIPTPQAERIAMEYSLRKLEAEHGAVWRGIVLENRRESPPQGRWHYSDQLLAHLMQICEQEGNAEYVQRARKAVKELR